MSLEGKKIVVRDHYAETAEPLEGFLEDNGALVEFAYDDWDAEGALKEVGENEQPFDALITRIYSSPHCKEKTMSGFELIKTAVEKYKDSVKNLILAYDSIEFEDLLKKYPDAVEFLEQQKVKVLFVFDEDSSLYAHDENAQGVSQSKVRNIYGMDQLVEFLQTG